MEDVFLEEDDGPARGVAAHQQRGEHVVDLIVVLTQIAPQFSPLLNVTPQQLQALIVLFGLLEEVLANAERQMQIQGSKEWKVIAMRDCFEELFLDKVNSIDPTAISNVGHQCMRVGDYGGLGLLTHAGDDELDYLSAFCYILLGVYALI